MDILQFEMIKQGRQAWKAWRQKHPTVKIDLSHADLRAANLDVVDLKDE